MARAAFLLSGLVHQAFAGYVKKSFDVHEFGVHFPDSNQDSCDVIMHAVGTATSVGGYETFAESLVGRGYVVVIVDPQKGNPTKLRADRSLSAFTQAKSSLGEWVSTCGSFDKWIMGGHSAGGGTAHAVLAANPSLADAVFSFDPFDVSGNGEGAIVDKPALYLGFDFTSCQVAMEKSAQMAYDLTNNERKVFVRIHHAGGIWPQYYHCIHVDGGCSIACSRNEPTPPEFFVDLSTIVDQFVQDAFARTWAPTVINYTPTCTMIIDMIHEGAIQGNHSGSSFGLRWSSKKARQASFLKATARGA